MADVEVDVLVAFVGLALADCKGVSAYSVFFYHVSDVSVIEYYQDDWEYGICCYQEEAVVEESVEVQGEGFESGLVLFYEVEWSNIGGESCEKHVDHEN